MTEVESSHRWRVLGIGVAANASFAAAFQGLPSTAVLMRADYHIGNRELGFIFGLLGLGIALSELPWGMLTDRWGDRRVLLTGLTLTGFCLAVMAMVAAPSRSQVTSWHLLAANMLVVGLMGGSVNGSSGRAVMAWFRESQRGLAMSIRQTAVPLGGGLGALCLPPIAQAAGFRAVYGLLSAACLVTTALAWRSLRDPLPSSAVGEAAATVTRANQGEAGVIGVLRDRSILATASAIGLLCAPQFAILAFSAVFLHDRYGLAVAATSAALVAVQVGGCAMRVWSGHWTDRNGGRRAYLRRCSWLSAMLFAALAAGSTASAGGGVAGGAWTLPIVIFLVLAGIMVGGWHGVAYTELATLAGVSRTGTALGLANTLIFVGYFVATSGVPLLLRFSWASVWLCAAVIALIASALFPAVVQQEAN